MTRKIILSLLTEWFIENGIVLRIKIRLRNEKTSNGVLNAPLVPYTFAHNGCATAFLHPSREGRYLAEPYTTTSLPITGGVCVCVCVWRSAFSGSPVAPPIRSIKLRSCKKKQH